jgi:hypothetical protein
MQVLTCSKCGATSQSDLGIAACPSCGEKGDAVAASVQSVAGDSVPAAVPAAALTVEMLKPETLPAATPIAAGPAAPAADPSAPAAQPGLSTVQKIESGVEIGLDETAAIAKIIGDNFAGTPVAAIFKLLGPLAGIGAAVLHQHLTNRGFDLSTLKDAEIL